MTYQAFLSHSGRDRGLVERIREHALTVGVDIYLAEHDPRPGQNLSRKVQVALDRSQVVVLLLTPNSYTSAYVHQEVGYAMKGGSLVLPLVEPSVPREALAMLDGVEHIPLDLNDPQLGIGVLLDVLHRRASEKKRDDLLVALLLVTVLLFVVTQE